MYSVEQALAAILSQARVLPSETIDLDACLHRVLAEDIYADINLPPFDNSAVDGYAVRAVDTLGAGPEAPVTLEVRGDIPAGVWSDMQVLPGTTARIMTGAPLPLGADAVVMVEDTRPEDSAPAATDSPTAGIVAHRGFVSVPVPVSNHISVNVSILEAALAGQHVRRAGQDVREGTRVLSAGTRLQAAQIGLLAMMGRRSVPVIRRPRVAVISTGDEIVEVENGVVPPLGKIRNSNAWALAALTTEAGALVHSRRHIPDDPHATLAALQDCADPQHGAEVIVTAGGVSVGERDYVKGALETLGTLTLWRVAMKPGKPLAFGTIGQTLFFGLPGNPVSALVTFELFVRPLLAAMMGMSADQAARPHIRARLLTPVPHTPGRREYIRALTNIQDGVFVTQPAGGQSSSNLHSLTMANSLLIVPEDAADVPAGEFLSVLLLD